MPHGAEDDQYMMVKADVVSESHQPSEATQSQSSPAKNSASVASSSGTKDDDDDSSDDD